MTDNAEWVKIERTFAAPVETVWRMWTTEEGFACWYGPTGASLPVCEMDVRVGGKRRFCMRMDTPKGKMDMWFAGEFREISPNKRLVYTESMTDPEGNILSPQSMGMPADHPETTEVIVDFESVHEGTRVKIIHVGIPAGSGGAGGWSMAMDKLDAALEA